MPDDIESDELEVVRAQIAALKAREAELEAEEKFITWGDIKAHAVAMGVKDTARVYVNGPNGEYDCGYVNGGPLTPDLRQLLGRNSGACGSIDFSDPDTEAQIMSLPFGYYE